MGYAGRLHPSARPDACGSPELVARNNGLILGSAAVHLLNADRDVSTQAGRDAGAAGPRHDQSHRCDAHGRQTFANIAIENHLPLSLVFFILSVQRPATV